MLLKAAEIYQRLPIASCIVQYKD